MKHKSGYVSIIGNPNVGKSTLMNSWVGEKISIITSKAQTTRHRILGIINGEDFQVVLSDTPGVIKPNYQMQNSMMEFVKGAIEDSDILIYMIEIGETKIKDEVLFSKIEKIKTPLIVLINKIDTSNQEDLQVSIEYWKNKLPKAEIFPISALTGFYVEEIFNHIIEKLPIYPPYFPKDQITDKPERFFVNESIREQILKNYEKEIPYSVEVETESFIEKEKIIHIKSLIYVERQSQKGIIIGHKGSALKKVGIGARIFLQSFFRKKINIELFVKVNKNWRNSQSQLKRFGYKN
ncbi:MAG: GTPase Era [Flavobacteriales bacterium]|jgi:GTP-binding protein Era|nr:MAG: GTPase Era [Flavobacteriales bacterium]|tara:strand:+ start:136 stop:1017 length:882 start_codon:yes stop_codon:yes gene_type:complete